MNLTNIGRILARIGKSRLDQSSTSLPEAAREVGSERGVGHDGAYTDTRADRWMRFYRKLTLDLALVNG